MSAESDAAAELRPVRVWDLPTRVFHWSIVLLLLTSWFTNRQNWMQLHFVSGYTMLGMLIFRLLWGFLGSETARFVKFLKNPVAGLRHLGEMFVREPDREIGHNAAGGWMVLVLLALLLVQVGTGLGSNDDVSVEGPLAKHVGKALSDRLGTIHAINFNLILLAVAAHVVAVVAYWLLKRQNLVRPMITGVKLLPPSVRAPRIAGPVVAGGVIASAASLAVLAIWLM